MIHERISARKIKFGDKELIVNVNPYQLIVKDNVFLQLVISENTFDEIHELVNNKEDIEFYVKTLTVEENEDGTTTETESDWICVEKYWGYTCGESGFISNYENGTFKIQLTRKNEHLLKMDSIANDITDLQLAFVEVVGALT